jgi:hypothetical protein
LVVVVVVVVVVLLLLLLLLQLHFPSLGRRFFHGFFLRLLRLWLLWLLVPTFLFPW